MVEEKIKRRVAEWQQRGIQRTGKRSGGGAITASIVLNNPEFDSKTRAMIALIRPLRMRCGWLALAPATNCPLAHELAASLLLWELALITGLLVVGKTPAFCDLLLRTLAQA